MPAHRFWRVLVKTTSADGKGNDWWVDEVSFRSAADADLCVGGAPMGSPAVNVNYPLAQAFDKTAATNGYESASLPAWLGYDHGAPVDVASVLLTMPTHSNATTAPTPGAMVLQWSDDGLLWVTEGTHLLPEVSWTYAAGDVVRFLPYAAGAPVVEILPDLLYVDQRGFGADVPALPIYATPMQPPALSAHLEYDLIDGGNFKAVVYTDINALPTNQPVPQRYVRLHDFAEQGRVVRAGWSKMVGGQAVCVFENLRNGNFYAVGFDHTGAFDAEVAAKLPMEPM